MKILPLAFSCVVFVTSILPAATLEEHVATGRDWLTKKNLTNAVYSFKAATELAPNDPVANVLYGATRLLVLPETPPVSEFLDRLGADPKHHRVHDWHPRFPRDNRGHLVIPPGLNAQEATSLLRNAVVRELAAADLNFGKVHDTNFVLNLTKAETTISAVAVDYGDVLLVRSALQFLQYLGYTLNSWNTDLLLADATDRNQTTEQFLARHPQLLTFATTNDLADARRVFDQGIALYLQASSYIRNRASNPSGLFRFDEEVASDERHLRYLLSDLREALNGPSVLRGIKGRSDAVVDLRPHFSGAVAPREMLPQFKANAIMAGTLPDPTFGGSYFRYDAADIERRLTGPFDLVPSLTAQRGSRQVLVRSAVGKSFDADFSHDLKQWFELGSFAGSSSGIWLTNLPSTGDSLFIRARESVTPANDSFDTRIQVSGEPVYLRGEPGLARIDPRTGRKSLWWSWVVPVSGWLNAERMVGGHFPQVTFYFGTNQNSLTFASGGEVFPVTAGTPVTIEIGDSDDSIAYRLSLHQAPPNDDYANRIRLTGQSVHLTGSTIGATRESTDTILGCTSATVWWSWQAPARQRMLLSQRNQAQPPLVAIYRAQSSGKSDPLSVAYAPIVFDAEAGATYDFVALGCPSDAGSFDLLLEPVATPPNDHFANRTPILETDVVVTGMLLGSTYEPEEGRSSGRGEGSIWWTWAAPADGLLMLDPSASDGAPWNLFDLSTGAALGSLVQLDFIEYFKPIITQSVTNGVAYQIRAGGYPGQTGEVVFHLRFTPRL